MKMYAGASTTSLAASFVSTPRRIAAQIVSAAATVRTALAQRRSCNQRASRIGHSTGPTTNATTVTKTSSSDIAAAPDCNTVRLHSAELEAMVDPLWRGCNGDAADHGYFGTGAYPIPPQFFAKVAV